MFDVLIFGEGITPGTKEQHPQACSHVKACLLPVFQWYMTLGIEGRWVSQKGATSARLQKQRISWLADEEVHTALHLESALLRFFAQPFCT